VAGIRISANSLSKILISWKWSIFLSKNADGDTAKNEENKLPYNTVGREARRIPPLGGDVMIRRKVCIRTR
jgi:hypothetical protein